jgi:hypothetical protein
MTNWTMILLGTALFVLGLSVGIPTGRASAQNETPVPVYELRSYTTHEGRLPALHLRFRDHTMRLFEKHGIKNVFYAVPDDKEETLVYLVAHKSRKAADSSWQAFRDDPEWKKVFAESHKDGVIVSKVERQFLRPTDYSPMK